MRDYKRLKDPVYGYINIPNNYVRGIINTPAFQRLRRIVQTSYAPLYAAALHNRFVHSLGVFHLGEIACDAIIGQWDTKYETKEQMEEYKEVFLLACLLHDIGHAPFSHTGKNFYLDNESKGKYKSNNNIVYLSAKQFSSNFSRPDISNINIVFPAGNKNEIRKLGEVISLLNGKGRIEEDVFYLYKRTKAGGQDKSELFKQLISKFV